MIVAGNDVISHVSRLRSREKGMEGEADEHAYDKSQYPILLKQYYMRLFPYEKYYQWLSYNEGMRTQFNSFSAFT